MGRVFLVELGGRAYRCRFCDSPLALADDILSRSFNCHQGRAYLFNNVAAHDKDQKYKEGKFVLERWRIADEIAQAPCGGKDRATVEGQTVCTTRAARRGRVGQAERGTRWGPATIADETAQDFNLDTQPCSRDAEA